MAGRAVATQGCRDLEFLVSAFVPFFENGKASLFRVGDRERLCDLRGGDAAGNELFERPLTQRARLHGRPCHRAPDLEAFAANPTAFLFV